MPKPLSSISLIFLFGLLTIPFLAFHHPAPLPSFYNEWLAAVAILGTCIALMNSADLRLEIPTPTLLTVALAILLTLQLILDMVLYPGQGRLAILYLLGTTLLTLSTRSLARSFGRTTLITLLAWAILASGSLNSLIAILQHLDIHSWFDSMITQQANTRAYGNLAQPNHFGNLETLAAVTLIYLSATRKIPLGVALPIGGALVLGMVLSGSRTVWLYLAAIPLLSLLVHRILRSDHSRRLLYGALMLVAAFMVTQQCLGSLEATHAISTQATERLTTIQGSSLQVHLGFMHEAWNIFLNSPILGAGYQQFSWHHFMQQAASPNPIFFSYEDIFATYAHNLIFHVLAEFGLAGFAILIGLGVWLIGAFRKNISPEQWLIYAMLLIILIHSMLEYPLYYLYFLAPFAILLTLASDASIATVQSRLATLTMPLILILGTVILAVTYNSYRHLEQAYGGTSQQIVMNATTRDHLIQASKGGFFNSEVDHLLNILPVGLGSLNERRLQLQTSDRSVRHRPTASRVYRHVFLLAINGNLAEAQRYLAMAVRAYPGSLKEFEGQVENLRGKRPEEASLQALSRMLKAERDKLMPATPTHPAEN